jgi:hypothetical protein
MVTALRPLVPYEPDTAVEEEAEMQVYGDDGHWHRRALGELVTACGEDIARGSQLRHNSYDGRLCTSGCFTRYELDEGARLAMGSQPIPTVRKDDSDG